MDDLLDFADDVGGINHDAFAFNAASEGQHLFDEACAALDIDLQGLQQSPPVFIRDFFLQQLDRDEQGGQHVVQVVRDAAGQRADALQALGPQELGLKFFPFGDVIENKEQVRFVALHKGGEVSLQPDFLAKRADEVGLDLLRLSRGQG